MNALAFAHAAWADLVACTTLYAMWRVRAPAMGGDAPALRVLLVRPCADQHAALAAALASTPPNVETVFALRDERDEAAPMALSVARQLPNARVVFTHASAPNRKAAQLAAATASRSFDVLVVADDDVAFDPDTLARLLAPLGDPRVAASWAAPVEIAPRTFGDRASAAVLCGSLHSFSILAALDATVFVGKLFAVRASALGEAGGFASLSDYLGEDTELARRLRARGHRVVRADVAARSLACDRSLGDVIARYARWIAVMRAQRPALVCAYPMLIAATPSIALAGLARHDAIALFFAAFALVTRFVLARSRRGSLAFALVADVVLLAAFVRALASRRVVWRGVPLRLEGERARDDREDRLRDAHP